MIETVATNSVDSSCEHCGRVFARPNTLFKHICEQKRRWIDRDRPSNRIGYMSWKTYFQTYHPSKKTIEYSDFAKSSYYSAFVKFGSYCSDVAVINVQAYLQHLLKNRVPIDSWTSDRSYTEYIIDYLKREDWYDAVKRTVDHLLDISQQENLRVSDVFIYSGVNKLCHMIVSGKISPWVLYQSATGKDFLAKLDTTQTNLIFEYINPERWNIKFKREADVVIQVQEIMRSIPL